MIKTFCSGMLLMALAGCGGGGGGGGSGGSDSGGADTTPRALGIRAVPGYQVQVTQVGPAQSGKGLTVQAQVTAEMGQGAPSTVEATLSHAEPTNWLLGSPVSGQPGTWIWTTTLPADGAGLRVWVRITDPDGNQAASGLDDFALQP